MSSGGAYSPGVGSSAAGGAYSPGVSGNSDTSSGNTCSGSCFDPNQLKYQYLQGYFGAHMLPAPSYRYVYLLWFITIVVSLVLGAFHMLGVGDSSYIGAKWKRWATKNRVYKIGKRLDIYGNPIRKDREGFSTAPLKPRKILTFPSFGRLVLAFFMLAVPIVLTLVGADFIGPNVGVFDFSQSWPQQTTNTVGMSRRAVHFFPRSIQWGQGSYPSVTTYPPSRTLPYRTWWTTGDRTGDITMGLVPIVLIMALKQVPFALLSTRFFGGYGFDRLSFLHKWGGRFIWLFGTAHLVTWCIQLNKDIRIGESVFNFAFMWTKFRWGWVSYGFLTAMTILSIGPIRNRFYEWFYVAHVVTVAGFIVTAMLHHPPLAQWMYIPLAWWIAERLTRAFKVAWINGLGFAGRKPQFALAPKPPRPLSQSGTWPDVPQGSQQRPGLSSHDQSYQRPPHQTQPYNSLHRYHVEKGSDTEPFGSVAHTPLTSMNASMRSHGTVASSASSQKFESEYEPTLVESVRDGESRRVWSPQMTEKMGGPSATKVTHPLARSNDPSPERRPAEVERRATRHSARYDPVNDLIQDYIPSRQSNADVYPPPPIEALPSLPHQYATKYNGDQHLRYSLQDASEANRPLTPPGAAAHQYPPSTGRTQSHATAISAMSARPSTVYSMSPSAFPRQLRPRPAMPADVAAVIRPGFAFVQLLPGKTLRLTLRTPNKMSWKPGQWVYLNIPSVRFWESHPFTIASAHNADFPVATEFVDADNEKGLAHAKKAKGEERTMVLLVRCRQGFTRHLWNYVNEKRRLQIQAAADAQHGSSMYGVPGTAMVPTIGKDTTGVHIRAIVDGPYGSADRTHWKIHSSIVIVCGGSGVTFGMSVLEHLCACMVGAMKLGRDGKGGKNFLTRRVRFVWIMREFSHLQWIASALRRCIEMVPPEYLQVDLYVTHFNHHSALQHGHRSGSHGLSQHGYGVSDNDGRFGTASSADSYSRAARFTEGPEQDELDLTAYDLTHFDGEDQSAPTALEVEMNKRIRSEGKMRRANTRRVTIKRKGGRLRGLAKTEVNREEEVLEAQRAMYEESHGMRRLQPFELGRGPSDGVSSFSQTSPSGLDARKTSFPHFVTDAGVGEQQGSMRASDGSDEDAWQATPLRTGMLNDPYSASNMAGQHMWESTTDSGVAPLAAFVSPSSSRPGSSHNELGPPPAFGSASGASTPRFAPSPLGKPRSGNLTPSGSSYLHPDESSGPASSMLDLLNTAIPPAGSLRSPFDNAPIDLDGEEDRDLRVVAELAQPGHPKLDRIIRYEVEHSQGRTLVAGCGPKSLDIVLRSIVSKQIDPVKVRKGDHRGVVNVVSECFEWGG